jgi:hypothetical protein
MKIVTGKATLRFNNLFEPNDKGMYDVCILIPKTDTATVKKIKDTIEAVKTDPYYIQVWGGKFMSSFKTPLRDGDTERDTESDPSYKGHYFINANTKNKPDVVGPDLNPLLSRADLFNGCFVRTSLTPAPYNVDGNKGIKFYLGNVQKLGEGPRIGGGITRAEDDFTAVEEDFLS